MPLIILAWMNHCTRLLYLREESWPNLGVSDWWDQSSMPSSQLWRAALPCPKTKCSSVKNSPASLSASHSLLHLWSCDHLFVTRTNVSGEGVWCILWKLLLLAASENKLASQRCSCDYNWLKFSAERALTIFLRQIALSESPHSKYLAISL